MYIVCRVLETPFEIMVEFQIQCGFKFDFMPFLCGVPVLGRGV